MKAAIVAVAMSLLPVSAIGVEGSFRGIELLKPLPEYPDCQSSDSGFRFSGPFPCIAPRETKFDRSFRMKRVSVYGLPDIGFDDTGAADPSEDATLVYLLPDGRVGMIIKGFPSYRFSYARDALTQKLGEPSSRATDTFQNAFGATTKGSAVTWDEDGYTVHLSEYVFSRDRSEVKFITDIGFDQMVNGELPQLEDERIDNL